MKPRMRLLKVFASNCRQFCRKTTVHGLNHLVEPEGNRIGRAFWIAIVCTAVGLAIELIYRSYIRYENNPVVVAINKNHFKWRIWFPGSTWCLLDKLDEERAADFITRKWHVTRGEQFDRYMEFLRTISNSNYRNLKEFKRFSRDPNLKNLDLQAIMYEINFNFKGYTFVTYTGRTFPYEEILTEEGICYSTTFLAPFISPNSSRRALRYEERSPELCMSFQLPCFARILNIPRPLKYSIHSPYEVPDSRSKYWLVTTNLSIDTYFTFLNMEAHSSLEDLRPEQRKCNLRETFPSSESPFYSLKLCQMNCRRSLAMSLCKCVPHFYVKREEQPVCDVNGLVCVSKYADYLITMGAGNASGSEKGTRQYTNHPCNCYPSCSETVYIFERTTFVRRKELHMSGMRYSWYVESYPKIAVSRHVIFGFEELLVNLGGIASFFVGSSIISAIEVVYFFTIRLFRNVLTEFFSKKPEPVPQERKQPLQRKTMFQTVLGRSGFRSMDGRPTGVQISQNSPPTRSCLL